MPKFFSGLRSRACSALPVARLYGLAAVLAATQGGAALTPATGAAAAALPPEMTSRVKPSDFAQLDAYLAAQRACRARGRGALLTREDERAKRWTVTYGCV